MAASSLTAISFLTSTPQQWHAMKVHVAEQRRRHSDAGRMKAGAVDVRARSMSTAAAGDSPARAGSGGGAYEAVMEVDEDAETPPEAL